MALRVTEGSPEWGVGEAGDIPAPPAAPASLDNPPGSLPPAGGDERVVTDPDVVLQPAVPPSLRLNISHEIVVDVSSEAARQALQSVRQEPGLSADDHAALAILDRAGAAPSRDEQAVLAAFYWRHVAKHPGLGDVIRPARARTDAQAERLSRDVLEYVRSESRRRSQQPRRVDPQSLFAQRLSNYYLSEYLANPTPEAGRLAVERMGAQFSGTASDQWEQLAMSFNAQAVPEMFQKLRPGLPAAIAAATAIISIENQRVLPYVDVPHLLGDLNPSRSIDTEVDYQGRNISHLLHWATGVKYSHIDGNAMRELFLGYEIWHLEQWDVFAEDPVNDIIVEEQGRIFGRRLAAGAVTRDNLMAELDKSFDEARAWMGSVLRMRQDVLDRQITSPQPASTELYFARGDRKYPYGRTAIHEQLKRGWDVETVQAWSITDKYVNLYAMLHDARAWEKEHGGFDNSRLLEGLARGKLDPVIDAARDGKELSKWEMIKILFRILDWRLLRQVLSGGNKQDGHAREGGGDGR